MKKLLYIIFLTLFCVNLAIAQGNTNIQKEKRIGYMTNYSNGNFTPSVYTHSKNRDYKFGYTTRTDYGTMNRNNGRGGVRRVTVYNGQGGTAETPGGASDKEGLYKYDESTGKWYYSPDNGVTWYEYREASGFWELFVGLFGGGWGNDWRTVNTNPSENASKWASNPNDPFVSPIGDCVLPLLFFLILYFVYKNREMFKFSL